MNVQVVNELCLKQRINQKDYWKDVINVLVENIFCANLKTGFLFSGKSYGNAKLCLLELETNIFQYFYSFERLSFEKRCGNWISS